MRKRVATGIAILLFAPAVAMAQIGPTITQSELGCAGPGAYIKLMVDVKVPAGATIETVRVYFRDAATTDVWFWVDASRAGIYWNAILPPPLPTTETIEYRSEVMLVSGTSASTEVRRVDVDDDCQAATLTPSELQAAQSMTVGTTAPTPMLPPGFASTGISTVVTEGGMIASGVSLGGAGSGLAGTGAAGAAGGAGAAGAGAAAGSGGTILGLSAGTAAIVGGAIVAGGIIYENNKDDSPN